MEGRRHLRQQQVRHLSESNRASPHHPGSACSDGATALAALREKRRQVRDRISVRRDEHGLFLSAAQVAHYLRTDAERLERVAAEGGAECAFMQREGGLELLPDRLAKVLRHDEMEVQRARPRAVRDRRVDEAEDGEWLRLIHR
eukprot:CAMPEP_0195635976 /NCGR_PEP_ID=MMETSP0815-20121206/23595_1 /TAXON_ID=97485 /ORGANISM="Prymnesium parvum, Strain Texoma1" /LENGTH=143 /DNA_ID=CAMNT_0040777999 /DNA_START=215 /DNA_END=647 /DNA_ORIENTATION=-